MTSLLPDTLETTYVRTDLLGDIHPNKKPLPGPYDNPNNGSLDISLNGWPWQAMS